MVIATVSTPVEPPVSLALTAPIAGLDISGLVLVVHATAEKVAKATAAANPKSFRSSCPSERTLLR